MLAGLVDWFGTVESLSSSIDGRFAGVGRSIRVDEVVFEAESPAADAGAAGAFGLRNESGGFTGCMGGEATDVVDWKLKLKGLLACVVAG